MLQLQQTNDNNNYKTTNKKNIWSHKCCSSLSHVGARLVATATESRNGDKFENYWIVWRILLFAIPTTKSPLYEVPLIVIICYWLVGQKSYRVTATHTHTQHGARLFLLVAIGIKVLIAVVMFDKADLKANGSKDNHPFSVLCYFISDSAIVANCT